MRNIPVADSVVYRSLYKRQEEIGSSDHMFEGNGRGRAEISDNTESSKWAFLKRLMEIEEEHDKRRMARERQERNLRQAKLRVIPTGLGKRSQMDDTPEPDPLSRWTTAQILTETTTRTSDSENVDAKVTGCSLPKVSLPEKHRKHQTCRASKSSTENGHSKYALVDRTADDINYCDHQRKGNRPSSEERRVSPISPPSSPASCASDRSRSPNAFRQHQHNFYASSASLVNTTQNGDFHSSVESVQPASSRTAPATPRPSRQLRLPPILLPRVYTMKPRPLKFLDFPTPTKLRGPITEAEWDELRECRYIRHVTNHKPVHNTV